MAFLSKTKIQGVWGGCFPIIDTQRHSQQIHTTNPFLAAGFKPFPFSFLRSLAGPRPWCSALEGTWLGASGLAGAQRTVRPPAPVPATKCWALQCPSHLALWRVSPHAHKESPRQALSSFTLLRQFMLGAQKDLVSHWVLQLMDRGEIISVSSTFCFCTMAMGTVLTSLGFHGQCTAPDTQQVLSKRWK